MAKVIKMRQGVFETNSSSTHSITMCNESDYDKWVNGELYLARWGYKDKDFINGQINKRLEMYKGKITTVRGIKGDMLPTEAVYATFIQSLVQFAQKYSDIEFLNTSLRGAKIDGFRDVPLEDVLLNTQPIEKFDTSNIEVEQLNIVEKMKDLLSVVTQVHRLLTPKSILRALL